MRIRPSLLLLVVLAAPLGVACSDEPPDFEALWERTTTRVTTPTTVTVGPDGRETVHQRPFLLDDDGRYVQIYGINVSGSHKAPLTEVFPGEGYPSLYPLTDDPALRERCLTEFPRPEGCVPEKTVSYVGRPFPLEEADRWFGLLAELGFNSVRLLTNWESVQPYRPGTCEGDPRYSPECYDLEYLAYYEQIIAKAREYGIYVLVDMHQDIFSRHLFAYYNEDPAGVAPDAAGDAVAETVLALFPPYTDWVRGHGAPRWVVETCLPEKDLDSPHWGMFRALGAFRDENGRIAPEKIGALTRLFQALAPEGSAGGVPDWVNYALENLPEHFEVNESSDYLPFTFWPVNGALSLDGDRCFAAFMAGNDVFPDFEVEGKNVEDYLQEQYIGAYLQLVERARGYDNVIGYDLMNEPVGVFVMLTAAAAYVQSGLTDAVLPVLEGLLGEDLGADVHELIVGLALLPPDTEPETLAKWGLDGIDVFAALSLNLNFDANHLQPFYERLGQRVQEVDENAIVWFEPGGTLRIVTGPSPQWDLPLTRPQGIRQLVFAPHWYPDIYPVPGFNSPPREFNPDEYLYRDFRDALEELKEAGPAWLGNIPVVLGEFGTYWNFGGQEAAEASGYRISAHVLNAYYEAFEDLAMGRMVWCFAPDNDPSYGEWWNHEDFSVVGPDGEPRGWPAYVRTHARATSGKLVGESFVSPYHFWDPEKGERRPDARYELTMESRETLAPTEVFVPRRQYPDGFYVWLSDGVAYFDDERQVLYWYPSEDDPDHEHTLRIEPPYDDPDAPDGQREARDWNYFFRGGDVVTGRGGVR